MKITKVKLDDQSSNRQNLYIDFCIKFKNDYGYIWQRFPLVKYKKFKELKEYERAKCTKSKIGGYAIKEDKMVLSKREITSSIYTLKTLFNLFDIDYNEENLDTISKKIIGKQMIIDVHRDKNFFHIYWVKYPKKIDYLRSIPFKKLSSFIEENYS